MACAQGRNALWANAVINAMRDAHGGLVGFAK